MLAAPVVIAAVAISPGDIFTGLTDACWRADMPSGATDTHCFTVAVGGKLVMDVHKVRNTDAAVTYEGVTLYRAAVGGIVYTYYNSLGDLIPGVATRTGNVITFAPDLNWRLSTDAYDVLSTTGAVHFTRLGPATDGGL